MGINNNGELVFPYGREDTDYNIEGDPSSGYVFNGATSVFWCRLRDLLPREIDEIFKSANAECFSANNLIKQFDDYQECYPEEIWRLDIQRKYIRTFTNESIDNSKPKHDVQYLRDMMQGRKKYQRRQWIRDQEVYFGTKHQMTTIVGDHNRITFRCFTPTGDNIAVQPDYTIKIVPYCDMYVTVAFGNESNPKGLKTKAGEECVVPCPLSTMDDTQVAIYCANRIQALNDLSACYIAANNFSMATKLKKLVIGNSTDGYNNSRLVSLTLGDNTLLEELDIRNCKNLTGAMNFTQYSNLAKFLAEGTSITSVTFAPYSKIQTAHLPDTVNTLIMQNLDKLTDFQGSLDALENLTLQGGVLSHTDIINKCIDTLRVLYLYDIDWTGDHSLPNTDLLNKLVGLFKSIITGFAYINSEVHNRELVAYANTWRDLDVRCASVIPQFKVKFVNYDGTVFDEQIVDRNEDAVEPIAAGRCQTPTRPSDSMYTYDFTEWDDTELTNITEHKTINAQYLLTPIPYTITFDSNGGSEVALITQGYGTTITIASPVKTGHTFIGWNPILPETMPAMDMNLVALWQINQYTITFDTDGGNIIPPITKNYGESVEAPNDPTRKGYTFVGWDRDIPTTIPDENITIKALWQINLYTVWFMNDDEELQKYEEVPYGSSVTYTGSTPEWKRGIGTFNGWEPNGTNIQEDTYCYAQFSGEPIPSTVTPLNECSWYVIKALGKCGKKEGNQWCYYGNGTRQVWFNLGDTKKVTLTDGEELIFKIYDFNHDDKVSGGKSPFTFGLDRLTKNSHYLIKSTAEWKNSYMRNTVLPLYYDKMPSDLKGYIEEVIKYTVESCKSSAIIETPGKLWLLSRREVAGSTYAQEGTLYPIFSDDASRVKYNVNGTANRWFLRSPSTNSSGDMMGMVSSTGSIGGRYATSAYPDPICFCFCV